MSHLVAEMREGTTMGVTMTVCAHLLRPISEHAQRSPGGMPGGVGGGEVNSALQNHPRFKAVQAGPSSPHPSCTNETTPPSRGKEGTTAPPRL